MHRYSWKHILNLKFEHLRIRYSGNLWGDCFSIKQKNTWNRAPKNISKTFLPFCNKIEKRRKKKQRTGREKKFILRYTKCFLLKTVQSISLEQLFWQNRWHFIKVKKKGQGQLYFDIRHEPMVGEREKTICMLISFSMGWSTIQSNCYVEMKFWRINIKWSGQVRGENQRFINFLIMPTELETKSTVN